MDGMNPENEGQMNNAADNNATVINTYGKAVKNDGTVFNRASESDRGLDENRDLSNNSSGGILLKKGDIVPGEYKITDRLGSSGEADLYLAERFGEKKKFVVKIFNRKMDEKAALAKKLQNTASERIARIYYTGEIFGRYFEVYEYYERGSLSDSVKKRTFTFDELENVIIPEINEALHDLHECGILHRDIKPNNIMWSNDHENTLVLIDFGLSSVARESKSIVVSTIGFTASYAAPEVLRNVYFDESDYYSFGILLYELFTGKTPFGEENSYTSIIAKPGNMPDRLYRLILGLTYQDLSYRHDLSNPNRRWTYDDVNQWIKGEEGPVPGYGSKGRDLDENSAEIPPISFCGKEYNDINQLVLAIGYHWEEGKGLLLSGQLSSHLRGSLDATKRQRFFASVIDDGLNERRYDSDVKISRILYALSPELSVIVCPMGVYETVRDWADAVFAALFSQARQVVFRAVECVEIVLRSGALKRAAKQDSEPEKELKLISEFEKRAEGKDWFRLRERNSYEFVYRLTGRSDLDPGLPDETIFHGLDELKAYLMADTKDGYSELYRKTAFLVESEHKLKPAVYGWLKSQGYEIPGFE